jgi:hypothetical protein
MTTHAWNSLTPTLAALKTLLADTRWHEFSIVSACPQQCCRPFPPLPQITKATLKPDV